MIEVGVLGATGLVGQRFIELLDRHPWFRIASLAASERSLRKRYLDAAKWKLAREMPSAVRDMEVISPTPEDVKGLPLVFSALPSNIAGPIEESFARAGSIVVSNAATHRIDPLVPVMNPEVNADHINVIEEQRRRKGWAGAILTNPNCTTAVLTLSLKPIFDTFGIKNVVMTSMQSLSGAGYPGVASLDIVDNVIPFIKDEEGKVEAETRKMLGKLGSPASFKVSASCNRVATLEGHIESVYVETERRCKPEEAIKAFQSFSAEPQKLNLPTAPKKPVVVRFEEDRPQPRFDRMEGNGMSVVVGRIRKDPVFNGVKYTVLGHNTIRGAAGCAVLIAELLKARGYIE